MILQCGFFIPNYFGCLETYLFFHFSCQCSFKTLAKFTGKHLCQSLFFNKVICGAFSFIKPRIWHRNFPANFAKLLGRSVLKNICKCLLLCTCFYMIISEWLIIPGDFFSTMKNFLLIYKEILVKPPCVLWSYFYIIFHVRLVALYQPSRQRRLKESYNVLVLQQVLYQRYSNTMLLLGSFVWKNFQSLTWCVIFKLVISSVGLKNKS